MTGEGEAEDSREELLPVAKLVGRSSRHFVPTEKQRLW